MAGTAAILWLEALAAAPSTVVGITSPDTLIRVLLAASAFVVTLAVIGPERLREIRDGINGQHTALVHATSDELARINDEGQALKERPFGDGERASWLQVSNWIESAAAFVEAVFGGTERDKFKGQLSQNEVNPLREGYDDLIEGRCNRLRDLAKRLGEASDPARMIRVSRRKLRRLGEQQVSEAKRVSPAYEDHDA